MDYGKANTKKIIDKVFGGVEDLLKEANNIKRTPQAAQHLTLALQCGGSDGYSGITANPALGVACRSFS